MKERRRKSKGSSGYGSFSSGDSDEAEIVGETGKLLFYSNNTLPHSDSFFPVKFIATQGFSRKVNFFAWDQIILIKTTPQTLSTNALDTTPVITDIRCMLFLA